MHDSYQGSRKKRRPKKRKPKQEPLAYDFSLQNMKGRQKGNNMINNNNQDNGYTLLQIHPHPHMSGYNKRMPNNNRAASHREIRHKGPPSVHQPQQGPMQYHHQQQPEHHQPQQQYK